jgi:hypothetical protein
MNKLRLERWNDERICRLCGMTGGKGYREDMTGLEAEIDKVVEGCI